jgi:hypothetical protein
MNARRTALFVAGLLINTAMLVWASGDALTPSQSLTVKHPAIFVPIVVSTSGANNSFYTSELTITNRGFSDVALSFNYVAAFGGGTGTAVDRLPARHQRVIPDAIVYLRSLGIPIPNSGNQGGTLSVRPSSLQPPEIAITVRTTTPVAGGRTGLSYAGIPTASLLAGPSYLCGLRQNAADRSNVAIQNAGVAKDGNIVLRLTVLSGDSTEAHTLTDEVLSPGSFKQFSSILVSGGLALTNGYVRIERVSGKAPYYAYAVVNDQANSDGSFVAPVLEDTLRSANRQIVPVIAETRQFGSELIITNVGASDKVMDFSYLADGIQSPGSNANFSVVIEAGRQLMIPDVVQYIREHSGQKIGPKGAGFAGTLMGSLAGESSIFLGARTSTPGAGGRFGVCYSAVVRGDSSPADAAWIYGLQQNEETRSNVALVNIGRLGQVREVYSIDLSDGARSVYGIDLFDGDTGLKVNTLSGIKLDAFRWIQIDMIFARFAPATRQGYARIYRTSGSDDFVAYGVINDGGQAGERTGDGAFVLSAP